MKQPWSVVAQCIRTRLSRSVNIRLLRNDLNEKKGRLGLNRVH